MHLIEPDGYFEKACTTLLNDDFSIPQQAITLHKKATDQKLTSKIK